MIENSTLVAVKINENKSGHLSSTISKVCSVPEKWKVNTLYS